MKVFGWICIIFAIGNFIAFLMGIAEGYEDVPGNKLGSAIMLGTLGAFLLYRANQKKNEEEKENKELDEWNK
jgi:putative Mn2+ efflux pump MntP